MHSMKQANSSFKTWNLHFTFCVERKPWKVDEKRNPKYFPCSKIRSFLRLL